MKANSRFLILSNLRKSQGTPTDKLPVLAADRQIYNDVESEKKNLVQRFQHSFEQLHGEFYTAKTHMKARKILQDILGDIPEKSCLANRFKLLENILENDKKLKHKIDLNADLSMPSSEFARYSAAITHADYLIARTGSVVVTSLAGGGRRLSVLPPVHIVLAARIQLVASLDEVWENLSTRPTVCSSLSIITGPSRTSDIEKELVLGAHGPKRLVVIVMGD